MSTLRMDKSMLDEVWPDGDSSPVDPRLEPGPWRVGDEPQPDPKSAPVPIGDAAVIAAVATGFGALYAGLRILEVLIDPKSKEKGQ